MKIVLFGATGFVGRGVLLESLSAKEVERVLVIGRNTCNTSHEKLTELQVKDFGNLSEIAEELVDFDACFWCLGTSSGGMDEATYTRITNTYTIHAARILQAKNPNMTFCFVSGAGADSSAMWARVKKRTEEELKHLGFRSVIIFRPAYIRDKHGATLRGLTYKIAYAVTLLFTPILRLFGGATSNAEIGQAMIVSVREQLEGMLLSSAEINQIASRF